MSVKVMQKSGTVGSHACVVFIKAKIAEAEQAVKFRDESHKTWRGGTDASWRSAGCMFNVRARQEIARSHARIAIKCRRELQTLRSVLEHLQAAHHD